MGDLKHLPDQDRLPAAGATESRLSWHRQAGYRLSLISWPILLGVALLLGSLLLLASAWPQKRTIEQLELEVVQLRKQALQQEQTRTDAAPQLTLSAFYQFLPPETDASELIGLLFESAEVYGIVPERVEYQFARSSAAPFSFYQIIVPVRADYVAIRKFAIRVQNTLPNAALNEISFKREEGRDARISARMRFTLYMRQR